MQFLMLCEEDQRALRTAMQYLYAEVVVEAGTLELPEERESLR